MKPVSPAKFNAFIKSIWSYYRAHRRSMPWRETITPYYVVVSEIMLQQTQVSRVTSKFTTFVQHFPTWQSLATASTADVLREWSGLGYNRRALYLKRIAEIISDNGRHAGTLPRTVEELQNLPGIGPHTAGSILAFAYNIPQPFIETNIRTVFIHSFRGGLASPERGGEASPKIHDRDLLPLVERALTIPRNKKNPREWYYALMDYGAYLKSTVSNPSRHSAHHIKQKPFKGSNRELRSKILALVIKKPISKAQIVVTLSAHSHRKIGGNLEDLEKEGFIGRKNGRYTVND